MNKIHAALIAVLVLAAACTTRSDDAGSAGQSDDRSPRSLPDSAQNTAQLIDPVADSASLSERDRFMIFALRRIGHSRDAITQRLGSPDSIISEAVSNRHMPMQTDSVVTLFYPDAFVTFYAVTGGRDILANVTVLSNEYLRLDAAEIGMPWAVVQQRFGPPEAVENSGYRYSCRACVVQHEIAVRLRDDRVESIGFSYYVD